LKHVIILLSLFLSLTVKDSAAQRLRSADSVDRFWLVPFAGFETWNTKAEKLFDTLGSTEAHRYNDYTKYFKELSLNMGMRDIFDYPSSPPADPKDVLQGPLYSSLPGDSITYMELVPIQLENAGRNAAVLRFEFERHATGNESTQYPGFLNSTTKSSRKLTGHNDSVRFGTSPSYLKGTTRENDLQHNALTLTKGKDQQGIFADSMWTPGFVGPAYLFQRGRSNRKRLVRARLFVASLPHPSASDTVIVLTLTERDKSFKELRTLRFPVLRKNVTTFNTFDTINIGRFVETVGTEYITFLGYWPGKYSCSLDYLEVLSAHVEPTDNGNEISLWGGGDISQEEAHAFSGEDFLHVGDPHPMSLENLVRRTVQNYDNHINYVFLGDEYPIGAAQPYSRLTKLFRDYSNGRMELVPTIHEAGAYPKGLPDQLSYIVEGVARGWMDSTYFADPKVFIVDPYPYSYDSPMPRRTIATDLIRWENTIAPTWIDDKGNVESKHYNHTTYTELIQQKLYSYFAEGVRSAERITRRNRGQRFGVALQSGNFGPTIMRPWNVDTPRALGLGGYRTPTGAEYKAIAHLSVSLGASGLYIYPFSGLVNYEDGNHYQDTATITIKDPETGISYTRTLWMGWRELYDTARALFPMIRSYGDVTIKSKLLGEFFASELSDTSRLFDGSPLPFSGKILSLNDYGRPDSFVHNGNGNVDPKNQTFVHVSVWLNKGDTLLYVTNTRTDDSFEPPLAETSTIDHRIIGIQLTKDCFIHDVLDEENPQNRNNFTSRVWADEVKAGKRLYVHLSAGEGILVRLTPTTIGY